MAIPSLLQDYKKFENIDKDPTQDYVDLSDISFISLIIITYLSLCNI